MSLLAEQLVTGYGAQRLLGPVDLRLPAGRFVCLIGANGAGKSTLIRTLCAMQPALAGRVLLDGAPLAQLPAARRARLLAVVLTDRIGATMMSGYELASLGRYPHVGWSGRLGADDHERVRESLAQAGATGLAARPVSQMSDGERQKIMIARALAQEPRLLVMDEATAFLDLPRRIETMQLLLDLARRRRIAVLLSTHDLELALRFADELWLLDGAGHLHAGAPEDLALSGALGAAFAAEGLSFDLESGELRLGRKGRHAVRLEGSGSPAVWARRALRRAGFEVADHAPLRVAARSGAYTLTGADGSGRTHASLGALVDDLALRHAAS